VISPWLLKNASEEFEKRFGIPTLRFSGAPLRALDTAEFLRSVGAALLIGSTNERKFAMKHEMQFFYRVLFTIVLQPFVRGIQRRADTNRVHMFQSLSGKGREGRFICRNGFLQNFRDFCGIERLFARRAGVFLCRI
jgi:hypothetical protein